MNASRFIITTLREAGCDVFFGLPGVHALGLWEALRATGSRYVGFRHEQAAAHAADGYGRATGRPGVVLLSTGPGAINALSAIAEAYVSSSPLIAISSAIPSNLVSKGKGYLHEARDLAPAFASVTRFAGRASKADELPGLLAGALRAATSGRPGPALIEVPVDLLDEEVDGEPAAGSFPAPEPPGAEIHEAARLVNLAARPVIWAGGGVLRGRASASLQTLAEKVRAPVVTTFMGKGSIPENHPLAVGTLVRQPEVARWLGNADLMLAVGTRFSGMATGNWKLEIPRQLIHIDVDADEIGRNYPVRLGIRADAAAALDALSLAVDDGSPPARAPRNDEVAELKRIAFDRARAEGPREMAILEAVRRAVDPEVVFVHDMTVPSYWAWPFFEVTVPGTFHSPYGYASLGFSFPAAIGVAAADPSRPVICFSGDGGFQYHDRELSTVLEHGLPVVVIVFNDRAWGVLRSFSEARYGATFGLDLPGPDFIALASAHRVPSKRVEEVDDLEKSIRAAIESGGPSLIEVPGEWRLPPPSEYYRR